jgi:hypothetical protein
MSGQRFGLFHVTIFLIKFRTARAIYKHFEEILLELQSYNEPETLYSKNAIWPFSRDTGIVTLSEIWGYCTKKIPQAFSRNGDVHYSAPFSM